MTDFYSDEEFAPIAAAMKELPYFAPSPHFADKVMARVHVGGAANVPAVAKPASVPAQSRPLPYPEYSFERRVSVQVPQADIRRSIPARIAAAALVASLGVTMATVALVAFFNVDLLLLVSRVFGASTVNFLSALVTETSATATASGAAASAATATGAAVVGSFAAGLVVATVGLRAAASASRRAA